MSSETEFFSTMAAVISAAFGGVSAVAALISARSAKIANKALSTAQHDEELRVIGRLASEVLSEVRRAKFLIQGLRVEYRTLFAFSGSAQHSSETLLTKELDDKLSRLKGMADHALLFVEPTARLQSHCTAELTRVHLLLTRNRLECSDLRDEIAIEDASIRERNNQYRIKRMP
jgi:hypothetical protein